jgi:hypothetical protein
VTAAASDYTERWRLGRASWRHVSEGGFDRRLYDVGTVDELTAKAFVERHHYSHTYPAAMQRYGLWRTGQLVGAAVLSVPVQKAVLTNVFPELEPYTESAELGRFVLLDEVPANAESWFLAEAYRQAAALGMRGVVSFSDPLPRRSSDGLVILPGHVGTIYQASNAMYLGRGTPRSLVLLPDGTVFSERSRDKIRSRDRGYVYAAAQLQQWGARPLEDGDEPTTWLAEAFAAVGVRRIRHHGNHRYAFTLGDRRARRSIVQLGARQPYPKAADMEVRP